MPEAQDTLMMTGQVHLHLIDKDGRTKDTRVANTVVTAGKNVIADRMKGSPAKGAMSHMALGTGNSTVSVADTALNVELVRVGLTSTSVSGAVITYVGTYGPGTGTGAIVEAGLFNASSAGDMLARTSFGVINKGASDTLVLTWSVTVN